MDLLFSDGGQPGGMEQTLTGRVALHLFSEEKVSCLRQLLAICALWLALPISHIYEGGDRWGPMGQDQDLAASYQLLKAPFLRGGQKLYFRSWQGAGFGSWLCLFFAVELNCARDRTSVSPSLKGKE